MKIFKVLFFILGYSLFGCMDSGQKKPILQPPALRAVENDLKIDTQEPETILLDKDVSIRNYFRWMDSVVAVHNTNHTYQLDEYILVHHNPWIIDTLAHTDYYYLMERGIFNEDPQALLALRKGQEIKVPDSLQTINIKQRLLNTYLDINIPAFRLRIIENGKPVYKFPIRVGQNGKRYLAMANREVDMRTKPGVGTIIRVNKNPVFINPKDNHKYQSTRRDDGKVTKLPAIPWLEPAINGQSLGQLIHPTTNLETLEKAYSNGCIGLREADAWVVYYYAPLGTKVLIRYDLTGKNEKGEAVEFKNIYPGFENRSIRKEALEAALKAVDGKPIPVCDCHL
ncbi:MULTISPECIES: L,D-transpeptidase [Aequorivita]|uniref:L,D-transpeptidase n=1 Tax=Aequorivita iocasae TaxID=2803865 RepID=A0ABX7DRD3_9FLAO|nr:MULTISPECIES: L,D-transpeptidase [Aequorivita]QQX76166.1 L,D-transpeptidase [Aequorivita iocasae]UCA55625.1 L,D-transpeptidase [Aequorivita sp. F7]